MTSHAALRAQHFSSIYRCIGAATRPVSLFLDHEQADKSLIHESQKFQLCAEASLGSEGPKGVCLLFWIKETSRERWGFF